MNLWFQHKLEKLLQAAYTKSGFNFLSLHIFPHETYSINGVHGAIKPNYIRYEFSDMNENFTSVSSL